MYPESQQKTLKTKKIFNNPEKKLNWISTQKYFYCIKLKYPDKIKTAYSGQSFPTDGECTQAARVFFSCTICHQESYKYNNFH